MLKVVESWIGHEATKPNLEDYPLFRIYKRMDVYGHWRWSPTQSQRPKNEGPRSPVSRSGDADE